MTETKETEIERRADCIVAQNKIKELWSIIKGNGKKGLQEKVIKLEVLIWIVIILLLGNGGLMAYTIKFISGLKP